VTDMDKIQDELNPGVLSEILAKNATELTDEEIDLLITQFRAEREAVLKAQEEGKKAPRSKIKAAGKKMEGADISLASLGLEDIDLGDLGI